VAEVQIVDGGIAYDDRGSVSFANDFDFSDVKRFYAISNIRRNYIRAWHGHMNEGKYLLATAGQFRIGVVDITDPEEDEELGGSMGFHHLNKPNVNPMVFYLNANKPQVLYIPPGHANGIQNLTENNHLIVFSTSDIEDSLKDDIRYDWDKWNIWKDKDYR